jgi:hypothetical protein
MSILKIRSVTFAIIVAIIVAGILAYSYNDDVIKYINPPPKTPPSTPKPFKTITIRAQQAVPPSLPAEWRERVVRTALSDVRVKRILDHREFNVSSVLPWIDRKGNLVGACVVVNFPSPSWLEVNELFDGKQLQYIGWVKELAICINTTSNKVVDVKPSLSFRNVPKELPASASPRARTLIKKVLIVAKNFLARHYNLNESDIDLTFYGILNNVAAVVASAKTNSKLINVEILLKIDVKKMKVIEAYKYIPHEIYVNPEYINSTVEGR